jgi:hypothetical protein
VVLQCYAGPGRYQEEVYGYVSLVRSHDLYPDSGETHGASWAQGGPCSTQAVPEWRQHELVRARAQAVQIVKEVIGIQCPSHDAPLWN